MKEEDKELLLIDLCARLPYGVKVWYKYCAWYPEKFATSIRLADEKIALSHKFNKEGEWFPVEEAGEILIKPYLRPMSSMTEEEILELYKIAYDTWYCDSLYYKNDEFITFRDSIRYNALCFKSTICLSVINKVIKWLNAHHYDTYNLIEKGLAIEVTEENNPYK